MAAGNDILRLPDFMRLRRGGPDTCPVHFLRADGGSFDPRDPAANRAFNVALFETLSGIEGFEPRPPVLIKVHVGEPGCVTRMNPAFAASTLEYLRASGRPPCFFGDSSVIYSGPRGHRENGPDALPHRELARSHGWDTGASFVVLDRPGTSIPGTVEFGEPEVERELNLGGRYQRFSRSGGFDSAGTVIHHAHLTLHPLSHLALCVKGLTMGLAGRSGKLAMHQCLLPDFDADLCAGCGLCVESCPEGALEGGDGEVPRLKAEACIGCGECQSVCPEGAVALSPVEVTDWTHGMESLPHRMTDYLMGLMDGRWEGLLNVAHLYDVTPLCDCVDAAQRPICGNIGFLVGRNPFAVDRAARRILEERLAAEGRAGGIREFHPADRHESIFDYAEKHYGVITLPEIREVTVRIPA